MGIFEGENLINLIKAIGHLGLFAIVFAESGLLIGFFLPGDSLLFTAGFLASQGHLNIFAVDILVWAAAILGDNVGYAFGKKVGPKIFKKEDSFLFHKDNLMRAEKFYEEHGPKTIIFARFMPVIRTFAPILAGVGKMNYKTFLKYNLIGATLWTQVSVLLGYFLGSFIPNVEDYFFPVLMGILILSFIPPLLHFYPKKKKV